METLLLVAVIFQTVVIMFFGVVSTYLVFRIFNLETNIIPTKGTEDKITEETEVPIDRFVPLKDKPLTLKFKSK